MRLKHLLSVFLTLLTLSVGQMWGVDQTVTYTLTGGTTVSVSGTAPDEAGVSASTNGSWVTADSRLQLAGKKGAKNYTLTLTGFDGCTITGLKVKLGSNASSGNAALTFEAGSETLASISSANLNDASWYGAWVSSGSEKTVTLSNDEYEIQEDEDVVLTITNTANSAYVYYVSVTYTPASTGDVIVKTLKSIAVSGQTTTYDQFETFSFDGICTATYSVTKNDVPQVDEQEVVTPTSVSSPNMSTTGIKEVTVTFTDDNVTKTANYNITVTEHVVTPGTYDITLANAFWGTSGTGANAGHTASGQKNDITVSINGNSGTQNYINNTETRIYGSHSITFSVPSGFVLKEITGLGTESKSDIAVATGSTGSITDRVWTGSAQSVTFDVSNRTDFSTVSVTYEATCTELGQINGSINLSQSGSDLVASGWSATTGGNETGYLVTLYQSDKTSVITSANTGSKDTKTYTFTNPGAGTYWVSVTPTYSGAGNYCASGDETFSAASIDISGKMLITFKKNGATGTDDQTQEVDYNTETALEDVSARSYTAPSCKEFGGWASSEANATAGTVAYANGANITVTEATTLWAIWKTKTFAVTDGTIAASVASHSYSAASIACGSDLTITCAAAAAYKGNPTVTATGTHGDITVNSATSVTIANVQSAIAVSIAYNTPKETATVILHDATGAHTQDGSYYEADNYTLPNSAAACTESELYGWYTETYVDQPTAPTGEKYIAKEASKALLAGENHFYAVYATIDDHYTNNYTKITDVDDLTSGDYLIAGISAYCMSNTVNASNYMNESNMSSNLSEGVITNNSNNNIIWTITKDGDNYTFYNAAATGNKYLALTTTSPAMQAEPHNFTVALNGDCWVFSSVATTGYVLGYYTYFKSLTAKSSDVLLYKRDKAPSAGAPYTTSPSCTTHTLSSAVDPNSPVSGTVELGKETLVEGKTTTAEATPSEHYTFSHWTISGAGASLSDANANPVTVTMGTADAEITAHFTEKPKCTVEFYNNGGDAISSTTYWLGETPEAPTLTDGHDHDACDETSTTHYGWTQTAWTETLTKEQVDAKTAADVKVYLKGATLPAVTAEDDGNTIEYHAVWVKKETSGSEVTKTYGFEDADDASCWTITDAITKTSGQGATGSYAGKINTNNTYITFNDKVKVTNFSFKLKRTTDNSNYSAIIETSADGSNWSAAETYPLSGFGNGSYTSKSKDFDGETALYVRFHCSNTTAVRYVDDISITYDGVTTTYSAFLTNCIPSHSVSSAVSPADKATVTLGANSVAEGSTTTAEYSDITAGYEFGNWTISGTGASLDDNTANPTTITMGTADVTVTANLQCVKPTFTVHPQSKTDYLTTDAATALGYTASAAGASLTQQWQVSADNDSWDNIDGATSATYTPVISTEGTKYYRVVVTNSECGESKTSDVATITSIAPSGYCISLYNSNNNGILSGFSNGGSGNEYTLAFTVPGKDGSSNWPGYWIGENEAWASFSANATLADMKFTSSDATLGLAEGATGTLHIWDDNKTNNLHVKFEPDGYGFRWGDHNSDDWTAEACTKAFTVDAGNANTYWTELVTLDGTNNTGWDYYVGLKTASGYVYSGVDNEASDARGISRTRSVTAMKVSNGTAGQYKETFLNSEATGTTGKFRIWNNNIEDYNFVCHFVPFYQLKYNANGGTGTMDPMPATPVSCEESAANRTVTVAANAFTAPTGKQFLKWNTAANGSGADVAAGEYVLTSDVTLYAIWKDADYTVTVNQSPNAGATTTGQTSAAHYGATINLTTTVPDGYEFINWTSDDVTISNPTSEDGASFTMPAQNVTVTANFQQIYTITWSANGVTTTSTVNAGSKLVLPASDPTSCNAGYSTFIGWYSVAAGSAEEPSAALSGDKADADHTPTGDETWYAVWANGELVGGWQKTTSIAVGDVVIFVQETASKEMSNIALINTNMCGIATAYSTSPAGTYPLTIETGNGGSGYSFKTSANTYLSWSSNNTLTTSDTKNNASSWTISTSTDGNFKFANVATTERIMQFNNNSGQHRWACYGNDNQTAFQIYKQTTGATEFISGCCTDWSAPAISYSIPAHWKAGDSNVDVTIAAGTTHGAVSFESSDDDVLTVDAETGAITAVAPGTATVTATWAGGVVDAVRYCTASSEVEVAVSGTVTITFNGNDATSGSMDNQVIYYNEATALSANAFSKTGYTFYGWAETEQKADAGNRDYAGGASVTFTSDKTLYAAWHANKHKVTLNEPTGISIEATGAADLANVDYGTSITLSAEENDGYVFTGWSVTGATVADASAKSTTFTMPDNDVSVTATYSTYTWDVASPRYSVTTDPKISYTKVEKFSTADVVIKENFKRSDDNTITKQEDYDGVWMAKLEGTPIANDADLSLEDNGKTLKLYIGEVEIASYTLTVSDIAADLFIDGLWGEEFVAQTGTYDMPTPEAHDAGAVATCKDHNIFVGWVLEANMYNLVEDNVIKGDATKDITADNNTYYAVWAKQELRNTPKTATTTSMATSADIDANINYSSTQGSGTHAPFIRSNGDLRLYKASSGSYGCYITITASNDYAISAVDITTAQSTASIAYRLGSYSSGSMTSGSVASNKFSISELSATTFTFANASDDNVDIFQIKVTYSKEELVNFDYITDCETRYDIEFDVNGAEGSYETLSRKANAVITLPNGDALSKTHYSFAGWYSASYDEVFAGSASYTVPVDGDILEAQWTEDHHAFVHFMDGESEVAGSPIKVYDGGLYNLADAPSAVSGKAFIGWSFDGSMYTAGQQNQHMDDPAEDKTYVAVWMPVIDVATAASADLSDGKWILVQNKSQLKAGDFIVIAAAGYAKALSTNQGENRSAVDVTKTVDTLSITNSVAPLFLQYDPEKDYYALYDRANTGYLYSNNNLKTQASLTMQGLWTIDIANKKASVVAQGKNNDKTMRYNTSGTFSVYLDETKQSDIAIYKWAKNINGATNVSDVANTDMVIVKNGATLTIDAAAVLDNVIVEAGGIVSGSSDMTVNNLTINSQSGASGQFTGTGNVTINGDLILEIKLDESGTMDPTKYYCISAPFAVSAFEWGNGSPMVFNVDYQLFKYDGDKRARTGNGWQRVGGTMEANTAYFIVFDSDNTRNQNVIRLKAADNTIPTATSITFAAYESQTGNDYDANWNGSANPTLHYIGFDAVVQVFDCEHQNFNPKYTSADAAEDGVYTNYGYVVGTPFFYKGSGTINFDTDDHIGYRAPQRKVEKYTYCVRISNAEDQRIDNQLYVMVSENAEAQYVEGHDVPTMNSETSNYGALIWTKNYGMRLAVEEAPMVNKKATYELGIFAPSAGMYTIRVAAPQENAELYLTKNGHIIWNLSMSPCEIELPQGQNNEYGLVLRAKAPSTATGIDEPTSDSSLKGRATKVVIDEHVYILRGGEMYDVTGKMVR